MASTLSRTHSAPSIEITLGEGVEGYLKLHSSFPITRSATPTTRSLKRKCTEQQPQETRKGKKSRVVPSGTGMSSRTRSQPPPLVIPLTPLSRSKGDNESAREESPAPPSPVPTEIVDNTPEDYVRTAKSFGIKVRDFAYEPQRATVSVPKEVWVDPLRTLVVHDQHVRNPVNYKYQLSGKFLRRLLDIGFVTEEEAERNWTEEDKEHLKDFDEGGFGARGYTISKHRVKPTAAGRERIRVGIFGKRTTRNKDLYVPPDTPEMADDAEEEEEFISAHSCNRDELYFTGHAGPTRREILAEGPMLRTYTIPCFSNSPSTSGSDLPTSTLSPATTTTPLWPASRSTTPERATMNPICNLPRASADVDVDAAKHDADTITPPTSPTQATPTATPSTSTVDLPITPTHASRTPSPSPVAAPAASRLSRTETCLKLIFH